MKDYCRTLRKGCSVMFKRASLLSSTLLLLFCVAVQTCVAQTEPDMPSPLSPSGPIIPGYKGMQALKGNWRPFNNSSPWNTIIPSDAEAHPESGSIIAFMGTRTVRLGEEWNPTLHVVGAQASKYQYRAWSGTRHGKIYRFTHFNNNTWWDPDPNGDDITNDLYPYIVGVTYAEDRDDGLMIIVDKSAGNKYTSYEVSHGTSSATLESGYAPCTTFNIWNLGYRGVVTERPICADAAPGEVCDDYWFCAGGHGAGTSLIAGLIRPKELTNAVGAVLGPSDPNYNPDVPSGDGLIHHALKFAFKFNRCGPPLYAFAYRNDGPIAASYGCDEKDKPVEGMLFQLMDPNNEIENSISNPYAKVIVRTLKTYGMVLVDNGSNEDTMALYIQNMCTPGGQTNRQWWDRTDVSPSFAGMYDSLANKIHATDFRVVNTMGIHGAHLLPKHRECPESHCHPSY